MHNHLYGIASSFLIKVEIETIFQGRILLFSSCIFDSNSVLNSILNVKGIKHLEINNCTFINNAAEQAIVSVKEATSLIVKTSQFFNNIGGGIYSNTFWQSRMNIVVSNCSFLRNEVVTSYGSGPVKLDYDEIIYNGSVYISNCIFESNSAIASSALTISGYRKIELIGCIFFNNTSIEHDGGAVRIKPTLFLLVEQTSFSCNRANNGGAFHISKSENVVMSDVNFTSNTATKSGRAIYVENSVIRTPHDRATAIHIESNMAGSSGGGAMLSSGSILELYHGTIHVDSNTAGSYGGGVVLSTGSKLELCCGSNTYFSSNSVTA